MLSKRSNCFAPNFGAFYAAAAVAGLFCSSNLVGLSSELCAGLLDISITEFQDAVFAALNQLPLPSSPNTYPMRY